MISWTNTTLSVQRCLKKRHGQDYWPRSRGTTRSYSYLVWSHTLHEPCEYVNMKLVILLKESVLYCALPNIWESRVSALQTFLKDSSPWLPLYHWKLQTVLQLWLPVWGCSTYLAFEIVCGGASCKGGDAVSLNVILILLRKTILSHSRCWSYQPDIVSFWNFIVF